MYDFNQKYIDILDECANYKLFKEDLLSELLEVNFSLLLKEIKNGLTDE